VSRRIEVVSSAAPLISWFHVNGAADDGDPDFVRLFVAWARRAFVPALPERALADAIELCRQGAYATGKSL
jgi:hypothetical protein